MRQKTIRINWAGRVAAALLATTVAFTPARSFAAEPEDAHDEVGTPAAPAPGTPAAEGTDAAEAAAVEHADVAPELSPRDLGIGQALPEKPPEHRKLALGIAGGVYGILYGYTYIAWYRRGEDSPTFQFHDEGWFGMDTYAGGADKLGHLWSNYALVRGVSGVLEWGGYSKKVSLMASTGLALGFFTLAEVKDAYKMQYGFSWSDMVMNLTGDALAIALELSPELDSMFDLRAEYFPSKPFRDSIAEEGPFNSSEDYTGQRYFLAFHLAAIEPLRENRYLGWTEYFDVSVGFQAAHFKPEYADPADHSQSLFVGVALNFQRVIDNVLMPPPLSGRQAGTGVRALRMASELIQVPYTTLRLGGFERTGPDLDPPTSTITLSNPRTH